jgi:hypothetical protein
MPFHNMAIRSIYTLYNFNHFSQSISGLTSQTRHFMFSNSNEIRLHLNHFNKCEKNNRLVSKRQIFAERIDIKCVLLF